MTKQLTRAEKLELIKLLEEKSRREAKKRPTFVPTTAQRLIVESKALERYLFCGNGFGKSTILVNELHWAATGTNPFTKFKEPGPSKICLVIDSPAKIEDLLTEYRNWYEITPDQLHKRGKPNTSYITYPNGSTITVLTHEVSPLLLEGSQWTHIFFDEVPPKPVYTGVVRGGRIKGRPLRILLGGTPVSAAWLRTDVYDPWTKGLLEEVECFRGRTDDNAANLEMDRVKHAWQKLSENELKIRRDGEFHDLHGLALSHLFRRHTHTIKRSELDWNKQNPAVLIMDPHQTKPHHAIVMGVDSENYLYVLEEYKEKAVARKFMKSLIGLNWFTKYRFLDIVYDSLGSGDGTSGEGFKPFGEVINEVLAQHGLGRARATSYEDKSEEDWIDRIQDALLLPDSPDNFGKMVPKLRVVADCVGTIGDIENVQWAKKARSETLHPHLDITHKDFLSCVKYGLATNLHYAKKKDRVYYRKDSPYGFSSRPKRSDIIRLSRSRNKE